MKFWLGNTKTNPSYFFRVWTSSNVYRWIRELVGMTDPETSCPLSGSTRRWCSVQTAVRVSRVTTLLFRSYGEFWNTHSWWLLVVGEKALKYWNLNTETLQGLQRALLIPHLMLGQLSSSLVNNVLPLKKRRDGTKAWFCSSSRGLLHLALEQKGQLPAKCMDGDTRYVSPLVV